MGLDPTPATVEKVEEGAREGGGAARRPDASAARPKIRIRAMMLIRTYRVRGHLAAKLDPLGLYQQRAAADLTPAYHGFSERPRPPIWSAGARLRAATVREIVRCCRQLLRHVGSNICTSTTWRSALHPGPDRGQGRRDPVHARRQAVDPRKGHHGEQWEKFLARNMSAPSVRLDGGESAVPALEAVIKYGGQMGVEEIDVGMAHRGRLNVLSNVMGKPYRAIFHEFAGGATNPADVGGSGDVKYHLGTSSDREFDGNKVHLALLPNPSHLEAVDPVVLGKARAVQTSRATSRRHRAADPAPRRRGFRGPGRSSPNASASPACPATAPAARSISSSTTRSASPPARSSRRSSPYPSDVAKGIRRRSFTSKATIPKRSPSAASWRSSSARSSTRHRHRHVVLLAASATTRAMSRASRSR
jgi:2-oxoglutarate dehydrogenase E1 component